MIMDLSIILRNIKNCTKDNFSLANAGLTLTSDIKTLVIELNNKSTITKLDLSYNNLDSECVKELLKLDYVTELSLAHQGGLGFDNDAIESLANSNFKILNLEACGITDAQGKIFAEKSRQHELQLNLNKSIKEDTLLKINKKLGLNKQNNLNQFGFHAHKPETTSLNPPYSTGPQNGK